MAKFLMALTLMVSGSAFAGDFQQCTWDLGTRTDMDDIDNVCKMIRGDEAMVACIIGRSQIEHPKLALGDCLGFLTAGPLGACITKMVNMDVDADVALKVCTPSNSAASAE